MNVRDIIGIYNECCDVSTGHLKNPSRILNLKMLVIYEEIRALQNNPTGQNYLALQTAIQKQEINDRAIIDWVESNRGVLEQAYKDLRALREFAHGRDTPDQNATMRANGALMAPRPTKISIPEATALITSNLHTSFASKRIKEEVNNQATGQVIEEAIQTILAKIDTEITTARSKALGDSLVIEDAKKELSKQLGAMDPMHQAIGMAAAETAIKAHPRALIVGTALIAAGLAAARASEAGKSSIEINAAGQGAAAISASGGDTTAADLAGKTIASIAKTIAADYPVHALKTTIVDTAVKIAINTLQSHQNLPLLKLTTISKAAARIMAAGGLETAAIISGAAAAIESTEAQSTDESILAAAIAAEMAFTTCVEPAKKDSIGTEAGVTAGSAFRKALTDRHTSDAAQKAAESAGRAIAEGRNTAIQEGTAAANAYKAYKSDAAILAATLIAATYPDDLALQTEAALVAFNAEKSGRTTAQMEGAAAAIAGATYPGNDDAKNAAVNAAITAANGGRQDTLIKEAMAAAAAAAAHHNNPAAITAAIGAAIAHKNEPEQVAASIAAAKAAIQHPTHANELGPIAAAQRITLEKVAKSAKEELIQAEEAEKPLIEEIAKYDQSIQKINGLIANIELRKIPLRKPNGDPIDNRAKIAIQGFETQISELQSKSSKIQVSRDKTNQNLKSAQSETARKRKKVDALNKKIDDATIAAVDAASTALLSGRSIPEATLDAMATGIAEVIAPSKSQVAQAARAAAKQYKGHTALNDIIQEAVKAAAKAVERAEKASTDALKAKDLTRKTLLESAALDAIAKTPLEAAVAAQVVEKYHANKSVNFLIDEAISAVQRMSIPIHQGTAFQAAAAAADAADSMSKEVLQAQTAIKTWDNAGAQVTSAQTADKLKALKTITDIQKLTKIAAEVAISYAADPNVMAITKTAVEAAKQYPSFPKIAADAAAATKAAYPNHPKGEKATKTAAFTAVTSKEDGESDADALADAKTVADSFCAPKSTLASAASASLASTSASASATTATGSPSVPIQQYQQAQSDILILQQQNIQAELALAAKTKQQEKEEIARRTAEEESAKKSQALKEASEKAAQEAQKLKEAQQREVLINQKVAEERIAKEKAHQKATEERIAKEKAQAEAAASRKREEEQRRIAQAALEEKKAAEAKAKVATAAAAQPIVLSAEERKRQQLAALQKKGFK
jgi:hypothetical protein